MDSSGRRPCFIEEDDGLASLADMEAGFSGNYQHPFFSRPMCYSRKGSLRNLSAMGSFGSSSSMSPRSGRFWDARFEEHQPHFLEACFLCKKPLGDNRDIFMYRLDTSKPYITTFFSASWFLLFGNGFTWLWFIFWKKQGFLCFFGKIIMNLVKIWGKWQGSFIDYQK